MKSVEELVENSDSEYDTPYYFDTKLVLKITLALVCMNRYFVEPHSLHFVSLDLA